MIQKNKSPKKLKTNFNYLLQSRNYNTEYMHYITFRMNGSFLIFTNPGFNNLNMSFKNALFSVLKLDTTRC